MLRYFNLFTESIDKFIDCYTRDSKSTFLTFSWQLMTTEEQNVLSYYTGSTRFCTHIVFNSVSPSSQ